MGHLKFNFDKARIIILQRNNLIYIVAYHPRKIKNRAALWTIQADPPLTVCKAVT